VKALKNEWMGVSHKRAEAFPSIVAVTRTVRRRMGTMCVCNDVVPSRRVQLACRPCLRLRGRRSEGRMCIPGGDWLPNVLATVIFGLVEQT
jgi:hypothetical protein